METNLNGLPHLPPLLSVPLLILSIQLGTISIFKMGPKPCWILPGNSWLAVYQEAFQSDIILMNFSRSKVWPEDVQFQKFNLVSVSGSAWLGTADFCELNSENTKTSHQNVNTSINKEMCSCQKDQILTLFSPALFLHAGNLHMKLIIIGNLLSESGIRARAV